MRGPGHGGAIALALAITGMTSLTAAALGPKDRRLTSLRHGITVEAPPGWKLSGHTGYRETVALLLHPDGSRITVTAALTDARHPTALVESNKRGLAAQGLTVSRTTPAPLGSMLLDASAPARQEAVRQIYLVREISNRRQAVVLTLVCRATLLATHAAALDLAFARLSFDEPTASAADAAAGGGKAGAGGSAGGAAGTKEGSAGQLRSSDPNRDPAPQQPQQR